MNTVIKQIKNLIRHMKLVILPCVILFFAGFMYLASDRPAWPNYPVGFRINPNFADTQAGDAAAQIRAIRRAADVWRNEGRSYFRSRYDGQTTNVGFQIPDNPRLRQAWLSQPNTVFATNDLIADCSAEENTFLAVAPSNLNAPGGASFREIIHFDICFNDTNVWNDDGTDGDGTPRNFIFGTASLSVGRQDQVVGLSKKASMRLAFLIKMPKMTAFFSEFANKAQYSLQNESFSASKR